MTPVATLKNGVRVANFSSPHAFVFDDGTILPGCDDERARRLMLDFVEVSRPHATLPTTDIKLEFRLSSAVGEELDAMNALLDVDIILVPLPVMMAIKEVWPDPGKCRVCRVADRVTKTIHADKFCI